MNFIDDIPFDLVLYILSLTSCDFMYFIVFSFDIALLNL